MKRFNIKAAVLLFALAALFSACSKIALPFTPNQFKNGGASVSQTQDYAADFSASSVPAYSGEPYAVINNNVPFFKSDEITDVSFEEYSALDSFGRCGACTASIGKDLMPDKERGDIGQIKPTGWHTVRYDGIVDGKYLYNRCHLIGYQLSGENSNEKNLITGTRYMNVQGMLPFENEVADYVKRTKNHVMYRSTPVFSGENLLADGVLLEAYSVEDGGSGVKFCVFCYNVQPGISIDYSTGESCISNDNSSADKPKNGENADSYAYVINKSSKKFHRPECQSAKDMKPQNRKNTNKSALQLKAEGYTPCQSCNP